MSILVEIIIIISTLFGQIAYLEPITMCTHKYAFTRLTQFSELCRSGALKFSRRNSNLQLVQKKLLQTWEL